MATVSRIVPCLWFADQAEEAATYYVEIFRNSRIKATTRYGSAGQDIHGRPPGSVMTQVVPEGMEEMLKDEKSPGAERAMNAMLQMRKIDIEELKRAYAGKS